MFDTESMLQAYRFVFTEIARKYARYGERVFHEFIKQEYGLTEEEAEILMNIAIDYAVSSEGKPETDDTVMSVKAAFLGGFLLAMENFLSIENLDTPIH